MEILELGPISIEMTPLSDRVIYRAEQSRHWYDGVSSVFSTAIARLRSRKDAEEFRNKHQVKELTAATIQLAHRGQAVDGAAIREYYRAKGVMKGRESLMVDAYLELEESRALASSLSAQMIRDKVMGKLEIEIPDGALVFVPLILEGGLLEPHNYVWVTADLLAGRIEYYHPKGDELQLDANNKVLVDKDAKHRLVAGTIAALMERTGIDEIVQNPVCHQRDCHSSAIHGMKYTTIRRREDKTFEDYLLGGLRDVAANRVSMADAIVNPPFSVDDSDSSKGLDEIVLDEDSF